MQNTLRLVEKIVLIAEHTARCKWMLEDCVQVSYKYFFLSISLLYNMANYIFKIQL